MKPFSILHISDLHRSPQDPISNEELLSALVSDRDRYIREEPAILAPEAIVVSGDIVHGVRLGAEGHQGELASQYAVAEEFLAELGERFLDGDRSRVIIVPGNHDVDWNTAFAAMTPVAEDDIPKNLDIPAAVSRDGRRAQTHAASDSSSVWRGGSGHRRYWSAGRGPTERVDRWGDRLSTVPSPG